MSGCPRHEGLCPPWWRLSRRLQWRFARERRIAYLSGHDAGKGEAYGEVYVWLEHRGYLKDV